MSAPEEQPNGSEEPSLEVQLIRARRACTYKERRWLSELHKHDFSPRRTSVALGMSTRTAWTFMRRPRVRKVMDILDRMDVAHLGLTRSSVIMRYMRLAEGNLKNYYRPDGSLMTPPEWGPDVSAAVQEYAFDGNGMPKIKLHDTKGANDALAKILRLFGSDRVELTGKDGTPLPPPGPVYVISREEVKQITQDLDEKF